MAGVFYFYSVCKAFRPITFFLGELCCILSTDSNSASNFAFYDFCQQLFLLILAIFTYLKAKRRLNGKKENILINVSSCPILSPFLVCEAPFCHKKSKSLFPTVPRRLFFAAQQRIAITWSPNYYKKMQRFTTRKNQKEHGPDVK